MQQQCKGNTSSNKKQLLFYSHSYFFAGDYVIILAFVMIRVEHKGQWMAWTIIHGVACGTCDEVMAVPWISVISFSTSIAKCHCNRFIARITKQQRFNCTISTFYKISLGIDSSVLKVIPKLWFRRCVASTVSNTSVSICNSSAFHTIRHKGLLLRTKVQNLLASFTLKIFENIRQDIQGIRFPSASIGWSLERKTYRLP